MLLQQRGRRAKERVREKKGARIARGLAFFILLEKSERYYFRVHEEEKICRLLVNGDKGEKKNGMKRGNS